MVCYKKEHLSISSDKQNGSSPSNHDYSPTTCYEKMEEIGGTSKKNKKNVQYLPF